MLCDADNNNNNSNKMFFLIFDVCVILVSGKIGENALWLCGKSIVVYAGLGLAHSCSEWLVIGHHSIGLDADFSRDIISGIETGF